MSSPAACEVTNQSWHHAEIALLSQSQSVQPSNFCKCHHVAKAQVSYGVTFAILQSFHYHHIITNMYCFVLYNTKQWFFHLSIVSVC